MYRAANLAEGIEPPEYYITDIGAIEIADPCVRFVLAAPRVLGGTQVLLPQVAIIRPLCTYAKAMKLCETYLGHNTFGEVVRAQIVGRH